MVFLFAFSLLALWAWLWSNRQPDLQRWAAKAFFLSAPAFLAYNLQQGEYLSALYHALAYLFVGFVLSVFAERRLALVGLLLLLGVGGLAVWHYGLWERFKPKAGLGEGRLYGRGELLLCLPEGQSAQVLLADLLKRYGLSQRRAFERLASPELTDLDDYYLLDIPDEQLGALAQIKAELSRLNIQHLEDNERIQAWPLQRSASASSTETLGTSAWNDPELPKQWALAFLGLADWQRFLAANPACQPQRPGRLFIIDTGVDIGHEDLQGHCRALSPEDGRDLMGHGSHCAGIAAALSGNGRGMASFLPPKTGHKWLEVQSIRVFDETGYTAQHYIIEAIIAAADAGADVISMSLGGPSDDARQQAYKAAVEYAQAKGCILVAAAGNESASARYTLPAAVPGIIAVTALDEQGNLASFSNEVTELSRGLAAPGQAILSTLPNNQYDYLDGTSMACPQVAALIAMLKGFNPNLDTDGAYRLVRDNAKPGGNAKTGPIIQILPSIQALWSNY